MVRASVAGALVALLIACQPGPEDPCTGSVEAWDEDGRTWTDLSSVDADGSTMALHLCAGTYSQMLLIADDPYELAPGSFSVEGAGVDETILDGGGLYLMSGTFSVSNLTVRDGAYEPDTADDGDCCARTAGAGVGLIEAAATFTEVRITGNEADDGAGLMLRAGSRATLVDSEVTDNDGGHGGGAALDGAGTALVSQNTDWGQGAGDNSGGDIAFVEGEDLVARVNFDGVANFECTWEDAGCSTDP